MAGLELTVRPAGEADISVIVDLASAALGWGDDQRNEALFRWKHVDNPFGRSPMWLAWDGEVAVGLRTLLRWDFEAPDGGVRRAVRAVDTATLPAYQGRGIFRRLTLAAVDELTAEGVDFVFNTPNDQSRPGYLKMGWVEVGKVPVVVRPTSIGSLRRMAAARVPATKWSLATRAGHPASELLGPSGALDALVAAMPPPAGLRTRRSPAFLRWRYASGPVHYRAVALDDDPEKGLAMFRLRDRGGAVEATVADLLVPQGARRSATRELLGRIVDEARPDYLIATAGGPTDALALGMVPVPSLGPILTWRALADDRMPAMSDWAFSLGDIELF